MTNQASEDELRAEILTEFKQVHKLAPADYTENCTNVVMAIIENHIAESEKRLKDELLYDLDEIDNKPWKVFRQLAKLMPEYADTYEAYEDFYSHGGASSVQELIQAHRNQGEEEGK